MGIKYRWTCPDCKGRIIEEILPGCVQTSIIEALVYDEESDTLVCDYGPHSISGGDTDDIQYVCSECGRELTIDELMELAGKKRKEER